MTNLRNNFNPIFIIGAPRSGTNILRDTLSSLKNVGTWDCDEIPYIWRYGNRSFETDSFTKNMTNLKISTYINRQFLKISKIGYMSLSQPNGIMHCLILKDD